MANSGGVTAPAAGARSFGRRLGRRSPEAAAKLGEAVGGAWSPRSLWSCSSCAANSAVRRIVARAEVQVQEPLQSDGVSWHALQHGFQQIHGLLRQAVAGEQVHIRKGLGEEPLGFFVGRFARRGRGGWFWLWASAS